MIQPKTRFSLVQTLTTTKQNKPKPFIQDSSLKGPHSLSFEKQSTKKTLIFFKFIPLYIYQSSCLNDAISKTSPKEILLCTELLQSKKY